MFRSLKKLFAKQPTAPVLHPTLAELVEQNKIHRLLEIGLGDGQRTSLLVQRLKQQSAEADLEYLAIDSFEGAQAAGLSLKQAYLLLRGFQVRPRFLPGEPLPVLKEHSNTIREVDLILLSAAAGNWREFGIYLPRMLSPTGRVFQEVIEAETQAVDWLEISVAELEKRWYRGRRKQVA